MIPMQGCAPLFPGFWFDGTDQGGGEALVFDKEKFDPFAFRGKGFLAIGGIHSLVEGLVSL
jgi:hypothetical protein